MPENSIQGLLVLDPARLAELAHEHRDDFKAMEPFPHVVLDNLFPDSLLDSVLDEFPTPADIEWTSFSDGAQKKLANQNESEIGPITRLLLYQLNSQTFISFLEALTAIDGLLPDPHLGGGGLHQIERGGFLKVHSDFNWHPKLRLDRRLNLLLYLNRGWEEAHGGHLELWRPDMTKCERRILPVFNRCVIFSTTDDTPHGHPEPLACPEGWTRKSLGLYYYTNGRPADERSPHHSSFFHKRPGEDYDFPKGLLGPRQQAIRSALLRWTPPIMVDAWNYCLLRLRNGRGYIP